MNAAVGPDQQVLLVGDGDFSFTLALTKYLPPSCIFGTNLETNVSIQKHKNAEDNMQELVEKGAHLILGVDARQLHIHPQVGEQRFQRIIFNFPHIGGKSNNKKNRGLLQDFFTSAAEVLTPEGEVMVTLCRGQGGTPADQPQRLWADSWQIVSMAANSRFILTQVIPFEEEIYLGYSCTGFRSQDKGFHTEGSLTHTFQRQDAVPIPQTITPLPVILDGKEFLCPPYLHSKISSYRKILKDPLHPFRQTRDALISEMETLKATKTVSEDQLPCVVHCSDLSVATPDSNACKLRLRKSLGAEEKELSNLDNKNVSLNGLKSPADVLESPDNQEILKEETESYFRTTLVENIPMLLASEDFEKHQLVLGSGLSFKQGVISPDITPVCVELLGLAKFKVEESELMTEEIHEMLSSTLKKCFSLTTNFVPSTNDAQPQIQIKTVSVDFSSKIMCKSISEEACIGHVFKISNQDDNHTQLCGFLISIDSLTQIRLSLDQRSILWQENVGKYLRPEPQLPPASNIKHKPISTFPLDFVHDMSFWENAALAFDEIQLSSIVRDVAGDYVSSVLLIDTYLEPETQKTGRCYRLTFQSWDLCLSYETSWKLQSLIRLVTAEKMDIILR